MSNRNTVILTSLMALGLGACGEKPATQTDAIAVSDKSTAETELKSGCIQGVVLNGLTGERIALPTSDAATGQGIAVRVHDKLLVADATAAKYAKNAAMTGEYTLCGIPLEDEFPLVAHVDGFQDFGAKISVTSTVAQRSGRADADLEKPAPTTIANLRLYPVGQQTADLRFRVLYAGGPLAGATVQLAPADKNFLDKGDFLAPINGAMLTQTAVTGEDGLATFPAASLTLGGLYGYTVLPAAGNERTAARFDAALTLGLNAAKTEHDAYLVTVDLTSTAPALKVVSQSKEPNAAGTKICVLNRPVDLARGTTDGITGGLENAVNATLRAPTAANDSSESVNVVISPDGYTVTLNPIWEKAPNLKDEPSIAVTYAGIVLKPRATPDLGERLDLASACELKVGLAE